MAVMLNEVALQQIRGTFVCLIYLSYKLEDQRRFIFVFLIWLKIFMLSHKCALFSVKIQQWGEIV